MIMDIVVLGASEIAEVCSVKESELSTNIIDFDSKILVYMPLILVVGSRVLILNVCLANSYLRV